MFNVNGKSKNVSQQQIDKRQGGKNTSHALPPGAGATILAGHTTGKTNAHPLHKGNMGMSKPQFKDSEY